MADQTSLSSSPAPEYVISWPVVGAIVAIGSAIVSTVLLSLAGLLPLSSDDPDTANGTQARLRSVKRNAESTVASANEARRPLVQPLEVVSPWLDASEQAPSRFTSRLNRPNNATGRPEDIVRQKAAKDNPVIQSNIAMDHAEPATDEESPKQLNSLDEPALLAMLQLNVAELDLGNDVTKRILEEATKEARRFIGSASSNDGHSGSLPETPERRFAFVDVRDLLLQRDDFAGLPIRMGDECQTEEQSARTLGLVSRELNSIRSRFSTARPDTVEMLSFSESLESRFVDKLVNESSFRSERAIPALIQIYQGEGCAARMQLVNVLASINGPSASAALAQRALFELHPETRELAVESLKSRARSEYRQQLIDGLTYPLVPVAQHAAEAIVQVNDSEAIDELIELLDAPDPSAPRQTDHGDWVVSEVVRINHLRNCLMCHAPSFARADPVRALIPTPGKRLPQAYYQSRSGSFVRADVTYIKQDFSAVLHVDNATPWPDQQRFDFIQRTRPATPREIEDNQRQTQNTDPESLYPQRQAVLFALRNLTGKDAGETSAAWRRLHQHDLVAKTR